MYFVKNTQLILELSFATPGTSAGMERVFSVTNALCTDEKNRFLVETIKSMIVTKTHFEELSCSDLYTSISNSPKFKKFVHLRRTRHLSKRKEQLLQR
jgi:hypothetical protein